MTVTLRELILARALQLCAAHMSESPAVVAAVAATAAPSPVAPILPAAPDANATTPVIAASTLPSGAEVRETSPQGRYAKLNDKLGSGAYKDVWRAYDTNEGIEVAWNVVKLNRVPPNERKRIKTEVKLLKDIQHKNVIKYFNSWVDREKEQIVFITEIMSSGSLKDYLRKNPLIRWHAVKRWARQILRGLEFLHANHVIHRDIKCDNIFINGATGDIRIGDLGLSTKIAEGGMLPPHNNERQITASAMTCLGTPEFMAPELYEEVYDEKVDIYAFGMCLLEIATGLTPYHQCTSAAQIYKRVLRGELPPELGYAGLAEHHTARSFIEACLQPLLTRPSAAELLTHPFFQPDEAEDYLEVRSVARVDDTTQEEEPKEEEEEEEEHEDSARRSPVPLCDEPMAEQCSPSEGPAEPSPGSCESTDGGSRENELAPAAFPQGQGREERVAEGKQGDVVAAVAPPGERLEDAPCAPLAASSLQSGETDPLRKSSSIGSSRLVRRLKTSAGGSSTYFSTSQTIDGSSMAALSSSPSGILHLLRPAGGGSLEGLHSDKLSSSGGGSSGSCSDVVTVVNVEDHPTNESSLVFFLRVPVRGEQREVEIEFEFALGHDDTRTILSELRDCEEMAGSPIDIKRLERVLEPLVEAGLRLSSVWRATNHTSLSQAISASLLQRQDLTPEMTDALRELRLRSLLTSKLGGGAGSNQLSRGAPASSTDGGDVDNNRSSCSVDDDPDDDLDTCSLELESNLDYQEILLEHQRAIQRVEKDYQQRLGSVGGNRERLEEAHRKEIEGLNARRGDLEKQLTSMREKFRERMAVLEAKKTYVEQGRLRLTDSATTTF